MPFEPRTTDQIYDDLKQELVDNSSQLTNFSDGGFNDQWVRAYAETIREAEIKALAAELAGYVDYAGKELVQSDLDELDITTVTPSEINPYMRDEQLDELGKLVGASRLQGQRATGSVTFQTSSDSIEIKEGYVVGTEPGADGDFQRFLVDADGDGDIDNDSTATVSPDLGTSEVTVDVIADAVGTEYNVGGGTLTYMPTPEPGVESATNAAETTGGENVEENEEFRERVKGAVFENSGGGTTDGIKGAIRRRSTSDVTVGIEEFYDQQPTFVDVIVDGGSESQLRDILDDSRSVGIRHNLLRPTSIVVSARVELLGSNVSLTDVEDAIEAYLVGLDVGETFSQSRLTRQIINTSSSIISAPSQTTYISRVENELFNYDSTTNIYELDYAPFGVIDEEEHVDRDDLFVHDLMYSSIANVTIEAIVGGEEVTLTQGSSNDYTVIDDNSDGTNDAIELTGNTVPDDKTVMQISYTHDNGSVTKVRDENDTTYTEGTDFAIIDNDGDGRLDSIDWSIGGSSPADGDRFFVDYKPGRTFRGDQYVQTREKITSDTPSITTRLFEDN